jgi:predicted nucleotidyltransferase
VDLSSPLCSLIPSLDSAVLEVLAGTESALSATQIARLAGRGSRQGQALALDRLVAHGLVIAEPANRGFLYRLNREHVLASAVLIAAQARSTVIERLRTALGGFGPPPLHASLFGSFVRRDAGPDSDIDLLVVEPDDAGEDWFDQLHDLADWVTSWTGNRLEFLVFTLADLRRIVGVGEPIVESWRADAITLRGQPIDDLLTDAAHGAR